MNTVKRSDLIDFMNFCIERCGEGFYHYAITGHFGGGDVAFSNRQNVKQWESHQRNVNIFFRKIARKYTKDRNWRERDNSMKVLLYPEVQAHLHFHGVLSMPRELNEFQLLSLRVFCGKEWKKAFRKGHFNVDERCDSGWGGYSTKKAEYSPLLAENFVLLPAT